MTATKICKGCGLPKPATTENFDRQKLGLYGFRSRCKECRKVSESEFRKEYASRDEVKAQRRTARRAPAKRAKELAYNRDWISRTRRGRLTQFLGHCRNKAPYSLLPIDFTLADYAQIRAVFGDACPYCECAPAVEFEHFVPVSAPYCLGTVPGNVVTSCRSCNASKKDRPPLAFLGLQRYTSFVTRLSQCLR